MAVDAKAPDLPALRAGRPRLVDPPLDYGLLAELAGFSVKLVWILGHGLLMRAFGDSSITPLRFSMLELIGRNPGLQQFQLADALGVSRPAATVTIDFWAERGCVERRPGANDRRSFGIFATALGETELQRLRAAVRAADDALVDGLTAAEVRQLRSLLAKIHL